MVSSRMASPRILHWDGKDFSEDLRDLPPGTYAVEPIDQVPLLTDEEEAGLSAALGSLHAGKGRTLHQVQQSIDAILRR